MSIAVPSAGELNKRITLFRHTDVPRGHVSVVSTDLDIMTVWAKIEPTGSVYWGTVQTEDRASHRIWILPMQAVPMPHPSPTEYGFATRGVGMQHCG